MVDLPQMESQSDTEYAVKEEGESDVRQQKCPAEGRQRQEEESTNQAQYVARQQPTPPLDGTSGEGAGFTNTQNRMKEHPKADHVDQNRRNERQRNECKPDSEEELDNAAGETPTPKGIVPSVRGGKKDIE